jgi:hypothetical protein
MPRVRDEDGWREARFTALEKRLDEQVDAHGKLRLGYQALHTAVQTLEARIVACEVRLDGVLQQAEAAVQRMQTAMSQAAELIKRMEAEATQRSEEIELLKVVRGDLVPGTF